MQEDLLLGKTKPAAERCEWDTRWGEGTVKQLGSEKDLKMLCEELICVCPQREGHLEVCSKGNVFSPLEFTGESMMVKGGWHHHQVKEKAFGPFSLNLVSRFSTYQKIANRKGRRQRESTGNTPSSLEVLLTKAWVMLRAKQEERLTTD